MSYFEAKKEMYKVEAFFKKSEAPIYDNGKGLVIHRHQWNKFTLWAIDANLTHCIQGLYLAEWGDEETEVMLFKSKNAKKLDECIIQKELVDKFRNTWMKE